MTKVETDIITRLRREILPLQGYKPCQTERQRFRGLSPIEAAFPDNRFPTGAIHEFMTTSSSSAAATTGFIYSLLTNLMNKGQAAIWITKSHQLFPVALAQFNIAPDRLIIIEANKEKELLWVTEEALKCEGLAAVICEIPDISLIASRRLQLAVETSGITGMIMRNTLKNNITSAIARWRISSLPCKTPNDLPGLGFPRWNIALEKVRNGRPASWQFEWNGNQHREILPERTMNITQLNRKTG